MTAIVVTYRSAEHVEECLRSLLGAGIPAAQVVVFDNASNDATTGRARALGVRVVESPRNLGFGRAVNEAATLADSRWLMVLNPDAELAPGALDRLLETADADPAVAAIGPRLEDAAGNHYPNGRAFPSFAQGVLHAALAPVWPGNPWSREYHMAGVDPAGLRPADWISGAAMMVRRDAFAAMGGFDPGYFMYAEDMDLCMRLRRAGHQVLLDGRAVAVHHGSGSSQSVPYRTIGRHHRSMLRFFTKRYAGRPHVVLVPLVAAGLAARALVSAAVVFVRRRRATARSR